MTDKWIVIGRRRSNGRSVMTPLLVSAQRCTASAANPKKQGKAWAASVRFRRWSAASLLLITALVLLVMSRPLDHSSHSVLRTATMDDCIGGNVATTREKQRPLALVVNLARRHDRWRRIAQHLQRHHPEFLTEYQLERLDAVDGHAHAFVHAGLARMVVDGDLSQRAFESVMAALSPRQRPVWGQELTAGAVGCLLSHAKAWERAKQLNASVFVLEDDVEILASTNLARDLAQAISELPDNFGLLYLGDMAQDYVTIRKMDYSAHLRRLSRPLWGTYAYVISPKAARRLLLHMYPAQLQVDSYIKQVAELYESDMPNFVLAQDAVYTDNSEARDTDAQAAIGRGRQRVGGDGAANSSDRNNNQRQLHYHFLLPTELSDDDGGGFGPSDGSSVNLVSNTTADGLWFDESYALSLHTDAPPRAAPPIQQRVAPLPWISYHSEPSAIEIALEQGLLTHAQLKMFATTAPPAARRWILCLAVAVKHGGICFTKSYTIVRSIEHVLDGVPALGMFMASPGASLSYSLRDRSTWVAAEKHGILSGIVYFAPRRSYGKYRDDPILRTLKRVLASLFADDAIEDCTWALGGGDINDACADRQTQSMLNALLAKRIGIADDATLFPPHIFDPLLPLRRPCRCTDAADVGCQSRCDRMIAPPFAAGSRRGRLGRRRRSNASSSSALATAATENASSSSTRHHHLAPRYLLHIGSTNSTFSNDHFGPWTQINPAWAARYLDETFPVTAARLSPPSPPAPTPARTSPTTTTPTPGHLSAAFHDNFDTFCRGVAVVAEYGGAFVADAARLTPRQPLLRGVLADWRRAPLPSPSPSIVVLWEELPAVRHPAASLNANMVVVRRPKHLSWRFFAAPTPHHPVAVRLAKACTRLDQLLNVANDGESKHLPTPQQQQQQQLDVDRSHIIMQQLTRALSDDASSIQFYSESDVFM
jgi:GR25 family glycosyltransferase involved in LPS biosynthesis